MALKGELFLLQDTGYKVESHYKCVLLALQRVFKFGNCLPQYLKNRISDANPDSSFSGQTGRSACPGPPSHVAVTAGDVPAAASPAHCPTQLLTHSGARLGPQAHDCANPAPEMNAFLVQIFAPSPLSLSPRQFL